MSPLLTSAPAEQARALMQGFAKRTGLLGDSGDRTRRYLWTDAFAVLNFLALTTLDSASDNPQDNVQSFGKLAMRTINQVHFYLGQFAANDPRHGWISGLEGDNGREHPTVAGLRIGKKMTERKESERYDPALEWQRDGQYYHYHTRWIMTLLKASQYFNDQQLAVWAAELSLAGSRFITEQHGLGPAMCWKMSVDLTRPLVPAMGAHDPLEGLLCALQAHHQTEQFSQEFSSYIKQLQQLCERSHWATDDALGIGCLLVNVVRATELQTYCQLPASVQPGALLKAAEQGLNTVHHAFAHNRAAGHRLAFRDCGLSLGLRVLQGNLAFLNEHDTAPQFGAAIWQLADDIEAFWLDKQHQQAATFKDHLDINEVSLAASLLASATPQLYGRL